MQSVSDLQRCADAYDADLLEAFDCESEFVDASFGNVRFLADLPPSAGAACGSVCGSSAHTAADAAFLGGGSGSPLTNRGISSQVFPAVRLAMGGFDGGCEAGYYGAWDYALQKLFFSKLERAKTAKAGGNAALAYIVFGGHIWHVWSAGARVGALYYEYVLEARGVKVYIHSNPQGEIQPVRVRIGASCLYRCNLFSVAAFLRRILAAVGFRVERDLVSRVDCQVTLEGVTVADFYRDISRPGCLVTRCRRGFQLHGDLREGGFGTLSFLSGALELCIYDKYSESLKMDPEAFRAFSEALGRFSDKLTRVEFRFRRDCLRRYGIDTFADLKERQLPLVQLACSDWFRVLARSTRDRNKADIPVSALWSVVQQAFELCFGEGSGKRKLQRVRRVPARQSEVLLKQAAGYLARAASLQLPLVDGVDQIYDFFDDFFKQYGVVIYEKCRLVQLQSAVTTGYTAGSVAHDGFFEEVNAGGDC